METFTDVAVAGAFSTPGALDATLRRIRKSRIAVFGDFCLDAYWHIDSSESDASVETGLAVRRVKAQRYSLGGAGNIVANLIALGVQEVRAIGIVGPDFFGGELLRLLRDIGVDVHSMFVASEPWDTMVYGKPYRGASEDHRLDFGTFNKLGNSLIATLLEMLNRAAAKSTAVIINQQIFSGILAPDVVAGVNKAIADHPETLFLVDSRHRPLLFRRGIVKLNACEAAEQFGMGTSSGFISSSQAKTFACRISKTMGLPAFVTRGRAGIIFADGTCVY